MFADLLTFLQKTMTNRDTEDSLETYSQNESLTQDPQDAEEQGAEPTDPNPAPIPCPASSSMQQSNTRKRSRKTNIEERMVAFMDRCDDNDADKDFFNSLLPSVRALTEDQKLEFRSQTIILLQRIKSSGYVAPTEAFQQHRMMGPSMIHFSSPQRLIPNTSHAQNSTSSLWHFDQQSNSDCHVLSRPGSSTSSQGTDGFY